jgi:arginine decarboxylase
LSLPAERLAAAAPAPEPARTWIVPHGTTVAHTAACLAVRGSRGRQAVVARDVHPGMLSGLIASGLEPHWLAPHAEASAPWPQAITPAALDAALRSAPGARAAIVVSPTFHGVLPDVAALTAVAHAHGAALIVDQTLGGHLKSHPVLPEDAIAEGADLAITCAPGSTGEEGVAVLEQGAEAERWLPAAAVERALMLCAPVSPAVAAPALSQDGRIHAALRSAAAARPQLLALPGVRVLGPELAGEPGVHAVDPLRLTVDLLETGRDARDVAAALRREAAIEVELATDRLLVLPLVEGPSDLAERFARHVCAMVWHVPPRAPSALPHTWPAPEPPVCSPRAAWLAPVERVPLAAAAGRVAAEAVTPWPPGLPVALPGERLSAALIGALDAVAAGGGVIRGCASTAPTVAVVAGAARRRRTPTAGALRRIR